MSPKAESVDVSSPIDITRPDYMNGSIKDANDAKEKDKNVQNVSFFTLFRFASTLDKIYMFLSILFSTLCGITVPLSVILFADVLQAMVNYGQSVVAGVPENEVFLKAITDFVIYNCALGLVAFIISYAATVLMNVAALNQVYNIRCEYLRSALNQDFEYYDTHQTGDFAQKMTDDISKVEDGIGEKLSNFIFYQSSFVACVVMALIKGWKLALLCLISFPITFIPVAMAGWISSRLSKKEAEATGKAGSIAEEVLIAVRTVYAFSGQDKEVKRYEKHLIKARDCNIKKALYNGISMGALYFCIFGSYALSFWFGFKLMFDEPGTYDVNTMLAVFFGVMTGTGEFGMSSMLMEVFGVARGAGVQIFTLINNVPKINPLLNRGSIPATINGDIELRNVIFHYPSRPDVPVLKGVNLSVKKGQSVALVGHSGCGKSTIIQLISRYYDVLDGSVCIDDNDVRDLSVRWLRSQVGLVSQEPVLFNATIRENIRYGRPDATDEEIQSATRQANAHNFIMKLPSGYDTLVGERGASLSGGQKQRIAIARALIRNPHILLLDEATSALDTASEARVQKALDKAQEGRTTVVVAHRLSTIKNVDMIYVFKAGEIVECGNHEELMDMKGHYYDMVMVQVSPDQSENSDSKNIIDRSTSVISNEADGDEFVDVKMEEKATEAPPEDVSFWRVVRLNAPEWRSASAASLCSLLSGFAMPLFAVIMGDFLGALSNTNIDEVFAAIERYAIIFVVIGVISGIVNFIVVYYYGVAGECLTTRLRLLLFKNLLRQEIAYFDDKANSTGALCARLSGEAAAVQGATGQRIGTVLQAIGTVIFSVALALYYQWQVGLISMCSVPLMAIVLYYESKFANTATFGSTKSMEASSKLAVEAVASVRTVASLGREEMVVKEYSTHLLPALIRAKKTSHWRGIVFGLSRSIFNFAYAASLFYGGTLMIYKHIDYVLILKSAEALLMGASSAGQAFAFAPNFQKGIKAAARIIVILNKKSKIVDPIIPAVENFEGTGAASLRNVDFKYPTRPAVQVLKDMSLDIPSGETIALVGASGCGKSTIIQLLERYYDPDNGVVTQDGIPLPKLLMKDSRQTIGFVQQEPILFDLTIAENIAYGDNSRTPSMEEIIDVAKQANIHNFILSLPMGYDTNIGSKGTQLSGGQKQRVAIARALIRKPKMLLLDEATSALDTESEKVVQEALNAAKAGRTCVMIAHRLSTVRDADLICVLRDGVVAESGTHKQLMNAQGLYYNLNRRG
ncbi:ATP-dependent translocase ABCB1 [Papilio machaon]|uniref:ATP-dependent translocase ABCB1 n=1 Tax=Papilio machaon TaxID=76193 RepID=UPI001E6659D9|nr:ATP-dependent translocase ABCB1 [Papilio machaon]